MRSDNIQGLRHERIPDGGVLEPIAIIGLSFRFPQGATDDESFWNILNNRICTSTDFPKDRINVDAFYNPNPKKQNTIRTKKAHFLKDDVRNFDAPFFGFSPLEAAGLDPQQRGLLETTYHAIENAGIRPQDLAGSNTSVHVGSFCNDYYTFVLRDTQRIPMYNATGCSQSLLSNRLSWAFDLRGTSLSIDTACSSGLVALDLSCREIWSGRSSMAICAASNVIFSPEMNITLSNMNFLSPDGKCYSFDHRASGYARGEGFAVLVLKPVSQAIADGDNIRALIRSTSSNQDGHTPGGITQPSKDQQMKLIRETYEKAHLDMSETRFFEAHGTGTAVGDPTEARAIGESFGHFRSKEDPLFVGAVKSNLGHLEGASGLAGVIKTVLALEKGVVPPNTNFETLNPNIDDEYFNLRFPSASVPWPETDTGLRRASVNSFGYGGTNAHVVLDDAQSYLRPRSSGSSGCTTPSYRPDPTLLHPEGPVSHVDLQARKDSAHSLPSQLEQSEVPSPTLLILSAADEEGVKRQVQSHGQLLEEQRANACSSFLNDYCYTVATRRNTHTWKSFSLLKSLDDVKDGTFDAAKATRGFSPDPTLGFIFTGQGAQWHGMGKELLGCSVFRESIQRSQNILELLGWRSSITDLLNNGAYEKKVNEAQFSQVLTTSVQIALVELFRWLEVAPSAVVGHSSGEIAAAYCAGLINHDSAIKISFYRGLLSSLIERDTCDRHSMAALGLSAEDARAEINEFEKQEGLPKGSLTISCINSPQSVTVSGRETHLLDLVECISEKEIFARKLKVGVGYHSPQMHRIASDYANLLTKLKPGRASNTLMVSSVTSIPVDSETVCKADYWVQNMVCPVDFLGAVSFCCQTKQAKDIKSLDQSHLNRISVDAWLEIGPHSALQGPLKQILKKVQGKGQICYTSALTRNQSALESVLKAVGYLYCQNVDIALGKATSLTLPSTQLRAIPHIVPPYPFNHSILYWEESQSNVDFRLRPHGNHDLVGTRIGDLGQTEAQWKFIITQEDMPWVKDHKVQGAVVYPAAGTIAMALEAAKQLITTRTPIAFEIHDIHFPAPVQIPADAKGVELRLYMSAPKQAGRPGDVTYSFRIILQGAEHNETQVCFGSIQADFRKAISDVDGGKEDRAILKSLQDDFQNAMISCIHAIDASEMYEWMKNSGGLDYGPSFQTMHDVAYDSQGHAIATTLSLPTDVASAMSSSYIVHPSRLDGLFQLGFSAMNGSGSINGMVPTRIGKLWIPLSGFGHADSSAEKAYSKVTSSSERGAEFSVAVFDEKTLQVKIKIEGLELTTVSSNSKSRPTIDEAPYWCSHIEWKPDLDTMEDDEIRRFCEESQSPQIYLTEETALKRLALSYTTLALQAMQSQNDEIVPAMGKYAAWLAQHIDINSRVDALELDALLSSIPSSQASETVTTIGQSLHQILIGEVYPSEFIFQNKKREVELSHHFLTQSSAALDSLKAYIDCLAHKRPDLRYCHVGAGTSSAGIVAMDVLANSDIGSRFKEFTFTAPGADALEGVRELYSENRRVSFRTLEAETDVSAQGFEPATYDVIVADPSSYAPKALEKVLGNIRKLLKPGGKLIIAHMEESNEILPGFVMGLLPEWRSSAQDADRIEHVVINSILRNTGFPSAAIEFQDRAGDHNSWRVSIHSVPEETESPIKARAPTLVLDTSSTYQQAIAANLSTHFGAEVGIKTFSLLEAASRSEDERQDYILLRELERPFLRDIGEEEFDALKALLQNAHSILWAKKAHESADYNISDGLLRVSHHENSSTMVTSLALETPNDRAPKALADQIYTVFCEMQKHAIGEQEPEYSEKNGRLCINRITRAKKLDEHLFKRTEQPLLHQAIDDQKMQLSIRTPGVLDSLEFVQDEKSQQPLAADEVEVSVRAIGVNFKDVLALLGRVSIELLGSEYAGIVTAVGGAVTGVQVGDRVATGRLDAFRTYARSPVNDIRIIPEGVSFAEAAAIPTAFRTAYYCLYDMARLQEGESILIHRASGATGQAAIQLAQLVGAEVFATVGSASKKQLLMDRYGLPEDHILYSRDTSFADGIRRLTNGRGVDVVLNSLTGKLLEASWEIIASMGRFIEIGLSDAFARSSLPMFPFAKGVTFSSFNLSLFKSDPFHDRLWYAVWDLLKEGKIKPAWPLQTFPVEKMEDAFRLLHGGNSSGKIVIELDRSSIVPMVAPRSSHLYFDTNATYVITGGLGGLGQSIARWLCRKGAKNLILISRSGLNNNAKAQELVDELTSSGVRVECPAVDITNLPALQEALSRYTQTMPPIKGCFQSAMVLRDSTLNRMSVADWHHATAPKVHGSWNMHLALPSGMDFFVLLSSVVGVGGNGGQSNYAAGNTFEDALARWRVARGEKAISIDLGLVLGEGVVAENDKLMQHFLRRDVVRPNSLEEIFALFEYYCDPGRSVLREDEAQIVTGLALPADILAKGRDMPIEFSPPMFSIMRQVPSLSNPDALAVNGGGSNAQSFKSLFTVAADASEGAAIASAALRTKMSRLLGLKEEEIELTRPLSQYGIDSLVALEIKNWIGKEMGAELAIFEISGEGSLEGIGRGVGRKSRFRPEAWKD
ncbi:reducing type I polyketide synthase [Byssothecium circinans]|uniref:Reducing type I polyketide synthase n=1 Tax=Byssothecium circinans TaxID=147558 RepID=A0A6A5TGK4_9PLEO|nr:reducing type I polyketide synthase [Byssothecium circinans]